MAVTLRCGIKLNSQNIQNNTSNVTAYVDAVSNYGSWNHLNPSGTVKFGGNASGTFNFNHNFDANTTTRIYSRTFNVTHNADGTGRVTMSATFNTNVSSGTIHGSASLTLKTIPRASNPTVSGSLTMGSPITIKTNRASTSFTHTLTYSFKGHTGTIASGVGASTTWTPATATFAPWCTDATGATCTITCRTYQGTTLIGTKTTSFTLKVPSSAGPTISEMQVTDGTDNLATYGAYVQGFSSVRVLIGGSSEYGAGIMGRSASLDGLSGSSTSAVTPITLGAPPTAGARTVKGSIVDTRGFEDSSTQQIQVAAYEVPTVHLRAYRYDTTAQEESDESTTIRIEVSGSVCDVNSAGVNTSTVKVEIREHTADDSGTWETLDNQGRGQAPDFHIDTTGRAETKRWDVRATLTDSLGSSASVTVEVGTAIPVMDFRGDGTGVAFYGIADRAGVRIAEAGLSLGFMDNSISRGIWLEDEDGVGHQFIRQSSGGRPIVANHMALANEFYLQGILPSGSSTNLMRVNASGQVELLWTRGGLKGRVMKQLWSGTFSTGSITVSEMDYYHVFFVRTNLSAAGFLVMRDAISGAYFRGSYVAANSSNQFDIYGVACTVSGTTLRPDSWTAGSRPAYKKTGDGATSGGSITHIYGIL